MKKKKRARKHSVVDPERVYHMINILLMMHFPETMNRDFETYPEYEAAIDSLSCEKCQDYKIQVCPGRHLKGEQCFDCFADSVINGEIEFGGSF